MPPARRRLVFLSAAMAAVAAVLALALPAGPASAAAVSAARNGVGASAPEMILTVGLSQTVSAGEGRCEAALQPYLAAGACVAAEDASIPDSAIIAWGGQGDLPPPGEVFSGAQGQTAEEAGQGVVHGSFRWTTAGDIRAGAGRSSLLRS